MKKGEVVSGFIIPPHPKGISIDGKLVSIKPLIANEFAEELFMANALDKEGINWEYLPYGPFESLSDYIDWIQSFEEHDDPVFFCHN